MEENQEPKETGIVADTKRGTIGEAIVAEVNRLVSEEGMTKQDAFKKIAADTGRTQGTVSVTYYRITGKKRKEGQNGGGKASGLKRGTRSAVDLLQELTALVRSQERELTKLRKENAMLREIRRMLR